GCMPGVRTTTFRAELPPPRPADHPIQVYHTQVPECPYEELGLVRATQPNSLVPMRSVQEAMLKRARLMGGDAILGVREGREAATSYGDERRSERALTGTVVRCREAGSAAPAP